MLKHFLIAALFGLFLSSGAINQANAAPFTPSGLDVQISDATDGSALTRTHGGWWAVPVVVGGVILYHHLRHHNCHRHCYWRHGHRHCYRRC